MFEQQSTELISLYPWITPDFFENILAKDRSSSNVHVSSSIQLRKALGKGQNYGSDILRATVNFVVDNGTDEQQSFIVKTSITSSPEMARHFADMGLFNKEITAYEKLLPEVERRLLFINDNSKLVPKCYASNVDEPYLVFEDLCSADKYENVSKAVGLDYEHYRLVLCKVARWHAITAMLILEDPSLVDGYRKTSLDSSVIALLYCNVMMDVAVAAENIGRTTLSEAIRKFSSLASGKALQSAERITDGLNVINHGDLWSNNIMFRHDSAGLAFDARLLDFQCCYWGSPMIDVLNVLVTSSHKQLRPNDWNGLIEHYHAELTWALACMDYQCHRPLPSLDDLLVERQRCGYYSLPMAFMSLALRNMSEIDDDGNVLGKFMVDSDENRDFRKKIMLNPAIRDNLEQLLDFYEQNGFFE